MIDTNQIQSNATSTCQKINNLQRLNSRGTSEINMMNMSYRTIDSVLREDQQPFQLEEGKRDLTVVAKNFVSRQNAIFTYKRNQSLNQEVKLSLISSPVSKKNEDSTNRNKQQLQDFTLMSDQILPKQQIPIPKAGLSDGFQKIYKNIDKDQLIIQYQQISGNGQFNNNNRWNIAQQKKTNSIRKSSYDSYDSKESSPRNVIFANKFMKDQVDSCLTRPFQNVPNQKISFGQNLNGNILQKLNFKRQNELNLTQSILKKTDRFEKNQIQQQSQTNNQQSALPSKNNQIVYSQSYSTNSSNQQVNNYQIIKNKILKRQLNKVNNEILIQNFSTSSTPNLVLNQQFTHLSDNQFRDLIKVKIDQKLQNTNEKQNSVEENAKTSDSFLKNANSDKNYKTQNLNFVIQSNQQFSLSNNNKHYEIQQAQQKSSQNLRSPKQSKDFLLKNNSFQVAKSNGNSTSTEFLYQKTFSSFANKQMPQSSKMNFSSNNQQDVKAKKFAGIGALQLNLPQKTGKEFSIQKESKKQNIMITPQQIQQIMESERKQQHIQRQNFIYDLVKQVEENPLDRLQLLKSQSKKKSERRSTMKKQSIPFIYDIIKSKNSQAVAVIQDILRTNNMVHLSEEIETAIQQNALEFFDKEKPKYTFQKHNTLQQFYQQIQNENQLNTIKKMQFQDFVNQNNNSNTSYYNDTLSSKNKNVSQIQAISENKFINQISKDQILQKKKVKILRQQLKEALKYLFKLKISPSEVSSNQVFSTKPYQKKGSYELICYSKKGDTEQVKDITMENKYLVYDFDYVYMTALHWACKRGHYSVVSLLIQQGADVDAKDLIGRTPLYFAISIQDSSIVELLLNNQANPWSTKEYNLNEMTKENSKLIALLSKFRKLDIVARMKKKTKCEEPLKNQAQSAEGVV